MKQGDYYYDMENDRMRVDHCPNGCDCEGMVVTEPPEPEESEYNDFRFDTRTGLPLGTPWDDPTLDYEKIPLIH